MLSCRRKISGRRHYTSAVGNRQIIQIKCQGIVAAVAAEPAAQRHTDHERLPPHPCQFIQKLYAEHDVIFRIAGRILRDKIILAQIRFCLF